MSARLREIEMETNGKSKILFLCTGNSCRSQMAEGWARYLLADSYDAYSAGTVAQGVNPNAVQVMAEEGVDISGHRSKAVNELMHIPFDIVVTVCSNAAGCCPSFPASTRVVHHQFDDPPALAAQAANDEEKLGHYRRVRNEIKDWVSRIPETI